MPQRLYFEFACDTDVLDLSRCVTVNRSVIYECQMMESSAKQVFITNLNFSFGLHFLFHVGDYCKIPL